MLNQTQQEQQQPSFYRRKRSELDTYSKTQQQKFMRNLPDIQSLSRLADKPKIFMDPGLNFFGERKRSLQFQTDSKKLTARDLQFKVNTDSSQFFDQQHLQSNVDFPKRSSHHILQDEQIGQHLQTQQVFQQKDLSKHFSQQGRNTTVDFHVTAPTLANKFNETQSKISITNSGFKRQFYSPSVLSVDRFQPVDPTQLTRIIRQQHLRIDDKEMDILKKQKDKDLPSLRDHQIELYEFYRRLHNETTKCLSPEVTTQSIPDITSLLVRLNRSIKEAFDRERQIVNKQIRQLKAKIDAKDLELKQTQSELDDFKQNKTLEAYFQRFRYIPDEETRNKLINEVNQYLDSGSLFEKFEEKYQTTLPSNCLQVLGDCSMTLNTQQITDVSEMFTQEEQQQQQEEILGELKKTMMQEALKIQRASELHYKKKLELYHGKVVTKTQATNTLSWNAMTRELTKKTDEVQALMEQHDQQYEEQITGLKQQCQEFSDKLRAQNQLIPLLQKQLQDRSMFKTQQNAIDKVLGVLDNNLVKEKVVKEVKSLLQQMFEVTEESRAVQQKEYQLKQQNVQKQVEHSLFRQQIVHVHYGETPSQSITPARSRLSVDSFTETSSDDEAHEHSNVVKLHRQATSRPMEQEIEKNVHAGTLKVLVNNRMVISDKLKEFSSQTQAIRQMSLKQLESDLKKIRGVFKECSKLPMLMDTLVTMAATTTEDEQKEAMIANTAQIKTKVEEFFKSLDLSISLNALKRIQDLSLFQLILTDIDECVKQYEKNKSKTSDLELQKGIVSKMAQCLSLIEIAQQIAHTLPSDAVLKTTLKSCNELGEIYDLFINRRVIGYFMRKYTELDQLSKGTISALKRIVSERNPLPDLNIARFNQTVSKLVEVILEAVNQTNKTSVPAELAPLIKQIVELMKKKQRFGMDLHPDTKMDLPEMDKSDLNKIQKVELENQKEKLKHKQQLEIEEESDENQKQPKPVQVKKTEALKPQVKEEPTEKKPEEPKKKGLKKESTKLSPKESLKIEVDGEVDICQLKTKIEKLESQHKKELSEYKEKYNIAKIQQVQDLNKQLSKKQDQHEREIHSLTEKHEEELQRKLEKCEAQRDEDMARMKQNHVKEIEKLRTQLEKKQSLPIDTQSPIDISVKIQEAESKLRTQLQGYDEKENCKNCGKSKHETQAIKETTKDSPKKAQVQKQQPIKVTKKPTIKEKTPRAADEKQQKPIESFPDPTPQPSVVQPIAQPTVEKIEEKTVHQQVRPPVLFDIEEKVVQMEIESIKQIRQSIDSEEGVPINHKNLLDTNLSHRESIERHDQNCQTDDKPHLYDKASQSEPDPTMAQYSNQVSTVTLVAHPSPNPIVQIDVLNKQESLDGRFQPLKKKASTLSTVLKQDSIKSIKQQRHEQQQQVGLKEPGRQLTQFTDQTPIHCHESQVIEQERIDSDVLSEDKPVSTPVTEQLEPTFQQEQKQKPIKQQKTKFEEKYSAYLKPLPQPRIQDSKSAVEETQEQSGVHQPTATNKYQTLQPLKRQSRQRKPIISKQLEKARPQAPNSAEDTPRQSVPSSPQAQPHHLQSADEKGNSEQRLLSVVTEERVGTHQPRQLDQDEGIVPQIKMEVTIESSKNMSQTSIIDLKQYQLPHFPEQSEDKSPVFNIPINFESQADFTPLSSLRGHDRLITTVYKTPPPDQNTLDYLMLVINEAFETIQLNYQPEVFLNRPELLKVVDSYLIAIPQIAQKQFITPSPHHQSLHHLTAQAQQPQRQFILHQSPSFGQVHQHAPPLLEVSSQALLDQPSSPKKKSPPRQRVSISPEQVSQPQTHTLEYNPAHKQRVNYKAVGMIGGGFIGHSTK